MQCPFCQAEIKDGSVVCTSCGEVLSADSTLNREFDIERDLKDAVAMVEGLPDDTVAIGRKSLSLKIAEIAALMTVVGFCVIGYVSYVQGWFSPERSDFAMVDFQMDTDFYAEYRMNTDAGRSALASSFAGGELSLTLAPNTLTLLKDGRHSGLVAHGLYADYVQFLDESGDREGSYYKHDIYQLDSKNYYSILGNYLLGSDDKGMLREMIASAEGFGDFGNSRTSRLSQVFNVASDLFVSGDGESVRSYFSPLNLFGTAPVVGTSIIYNKGEDGLVAQGDYYIRPSSDLSGSLGVSTTFDAELLRYVSGFQGLSGLVNFSSIRPVYLSFLDAFKIKSFSFEDFLQNEVGISFRSDVLGLVEEEGLLLLHDGEGTRHGESLSLITRLDEDGKVLDRLSRIQDALELYYGQDSTNDFRLMFDEETGEAVWQAVRLSTDLQTTDYYGTSVTSRYIGEVYGREVGIYYGIFDGSLFISSSMDALKSLLDFARISDRDLSVDVAQNFTVVEGSGSAILSEERLIHSFVNVDSFFGLFPELKETSLYDRFGSYSRISLEGGFDSGIIRGNYTIDY